MKIVLKLLIIPVLVVILFLKYVLKFLGTLGYLILWIVSGACLILGTIELIKAWQDGLLMANLSSYGFLYLFGFGATALGFAILVVPVFLEVTAERMVDFLFS